MSQALFDDLSDVQADWDAAIALELQTKPKPFSSQSPILDRPFEEALWNNAIEYPFKHWTRSRYSDGSFGIWYGAGTVETTVRETVHHWRAGFLADAGLTAGGICIERKLYAVRCDAALVDFRPAVAAFPAIVDPVDYSLTQQIGARLHREGHPGLATRSARAEGDVFAILTRNVLSNPRQVGFMTYKTTSAGVAVERTPGQVWLEVP